MDRRDIEQYKYNDRRRNIQRWHRKVMDDKDLSVLAQLFLLEDIPS